MASGNEDQNKTGFTITDRRGVGEGQPAPAEGSSPDASGAGAYPPVDFHTFILSLGSSALFHMGELEGPDGQAAQIDLPLAKHTIDVIAMLEEKTKGNLSAPEANLVESLLYDLRLRFVEKSKS